MFLSRKRSKKSRLSLSHTNPTTLAPGNLVPISFTRIYNGDELSFRPSAFVQCMPMVAPLVNGFKIKFEYFFCPDRLYNVDMLLDKRDVTDNPDSVTYPFITAPTINSAALLKIENVVNAHNFAKNVVMPGSLADYCDFPVGYYPIGLKGARARFNALKVAAYLDIINEYYVNQQVDKIYTANWRMQGVVGGYGNTEVLHSDLQQVVSNLKTGRGIDILTAGSGTGDGTEDTEIGTWQWFCSRNSIFQRSFPDYYLEAWMRTSGYQNAAVTVEVDDGSGTVLVRNVSAASHMQRFMDLAFAGGSRFSDFQAAQFDATSIKHSTSPLFLGADRQYLGSNVIYQTTGFENRESPLGAFAGQSAGGQAFRKRHYKFGEPGYFVVIASLCPDVIYSRGIDPLQRELTLADTYVPALDNISMQPLMREELDAQGGVSFAVDNEDAPTALTIQVAHTDEDFKNTALGYVPAWSHIMQQVSRSHGRLNTSLSYWLLGRKYGFGQDTNELARTWLTKFVADNESFELNDQEAISAFIENSALVKEFSPYIRSNAYNDVFSDTRHDAQNFVMTFTADMDVRRLKSKVNVPTTL